MTTPLEKEIATYTEANPRSEELHNQAKKHMPGGDTRNSIFWDPFPLYVTDGNGTSPLDALFDLTAGLEGFSDPADCSEDGGSPEIC